MIRVANMSLTEWWLFGGIAVVSLLLEMAALIWPHSLPVITGTLRANGCRWACWPFLLGFIPGHVWSPGWLRIEALARVQPVSIPTIAACLLVYVLFGPRLSITQAFLLVPAAYVAGALFWNTAR